MITPQIWNYHKFNLHKYFEINKFNTSVVVMISKSSLYVTIDTKFYENIVFFSHKLMLLFIIKSTELMSTFSVWQIKSQVTLRNWVFLRIELQGTKI